MTENATAADQSHPNAIGITGENYGTWCLVVGIAFGFLGASFFGHELYRAICTALERGGSLEIGSLADWSAAIGTIGAILFGVIQFQRQVKETRRLHNEQMETTRRLHQAEMKAQYDVRLYELQKDAAEILPAIDTLVNNLMRYWSLSITNIKKEEDWSDEDFLEFEKDFKNIIPEIHYIIKFPPDYKSRFAGIRRDIKKAIQDAKTWQRDGQSEKEAQNWLAQLEKSFWAVDTLQRDLNDFMELGEQPPARTLRAS
ncbi:hypothetical protein [Radicibacter daui]|uniref:hypothetical protein n=1 Tax=Radicibacter daui TaxID=3064829 RepID=UPI004046CC58